MDNFVRFITSTKHRMMASCNIFSTFSTVIIASLHDFRRLYPWNACYEVLCRTMATDDGTLMRDTLSGALEEARTIDWMRETTRLLRAKYSIRAMWESFESRHDRSPSDVELVHMEH